MHLLVCPTKVECSTLCDKELKVLIHYSGGAIKRDWSMATSRQWLLAGLWWIQPSNLRSHAYGLKALPLWLDTATKPTKKLTRQEKCPGNGALCFAPVEIETCCQTKPTAPLVKFPGLTMKPTYTAWDLGADHRRDLGRPQIPIHSLVVKRVHGFTPMVIEE